MELVTSSDSSTWVPGGGWFWVPTQKVQRPQTIQHTRKEEEEQKEEHPLMTKNGGDATAEDY